MYIWRIGPLFSYSIHTLTNSRSPWSPSSPSNRFEAASAQCCCCFSCNRYGWCYQYEFLWLLQEGCLGFESIRCFKHISLVSCSMSRKGSEKLAVHHFHPTSTPPTLPSHSLDIWGEVSHTKSMWQISFLLLNQPSNSWRSLCQSIVPPSSQLSHSSCCHTTAIISHNFLKGRSQWIATHHQTSQLPRFFWAWKNLRFLFQHKGGTMENIPPIHLLHFLKWKCTSPEKFIIDPSDKARILASWVHPKVKHAIPEIQRNLFGVSNIRLGNYTKRKVITLAKFRAFFRKIPFQ